MIFYVVNFSVPESLVDYLLTLIPFLRLQFEWRRDISRLYEDNIATKSHKIEWNVLKISLLRGTHICVPYNSPL